MCKFECGSEFFNFNKLTNTFKLTHRNTNKTSYLAGEEFHTPPALSLVVFYLYCVGNNETNKRSPNRPMSHKKKSIPTSTELSRKRSKKVSKHSIAAPQ